MKTRILFLLCFLYSVGCDRPRMPMPPAPEYDHPAEESFAWAMERLEHIIEEMPQSPRGMGLRVTYKVSHRVIPPKSDKEHYRGEVTILTKAIFAHRTPSLNEKAAREKKKAPPVKDPHDFPANDPTGNFDDVPDLTAQAPKQPQAEIPIGPQEREDKRVFELEYKEDQWILLDEPEEGVEKTWFDYALQRDSSDDGSGDDGLSDEETGDEPSGDDSRADDLNDESEEAASPDSDEEAE